MHFGFPPAHRRNTVGKRPTFVGDRPTSVAKKRHKKFKPLPPTLVQIITGGLAGTFCQESFMAKKHKRSLRLLAGALALVSASALAGEITLFQNRDFRGNTRSEEHTSALQSLTN